MDNYLLFYGNDFYPGGGWGDFHAAYPTQDEAERVGKGMMQRYGPDWWHVVDITSLDQVSGGHYDYTQHYDQ